MKKRRTPLIAALVLLMTVADRSGLCGITVIAAALHECGHLAAARAMKIPLGDFRLGLLGARLTVKGRILSYGEEWLLAAAGPLASLLCAAAGAPLFGRFPAVMTFSGVSLLLGCLNLLPIRTFDGGRMLECGIAGLWGVRAAERVLCGTSFLFLFLLWGSAVYFLLKAGDGLSLLFFSMTLFGRFFSEESS